MATQSDVSQETAVQTGSVKIRLRDAALSPDDLRDMLQTVVDHLNPIHHEVTIEFDDQLAATVVEWNAPKPLSLQVEAVTHPTFEECLADVLARRESALKRLAE